MLSVKYRLRREKDFQQVFKKGRAVFAQNLMLKFAPNNLAQSRFGVVVSTKVAKKAVVRNKLKRRLREIIHSQVGNIKPGFDVVVLTRVGITASDYQELEKILTGLFKKVRLYSHSEAERGEMKDLIV